MQSFRTELENPMVERDIIDLERKIRLFNEGRIDEEKFRSLRLARGVYGQRQKGVQMVRIKLPYGRLTTAQLRRIADVSDEYSTGSLHLTTRQDIQIHHVSLDRTPELWRELELDRITLREACGNTVRNVTASATAGIDPDEPFDVSPYAHAVFAYFLRNPVCQEMGRKFKIAFSSGPGDTALTWIHDLGFLPRVRVEGDRGVRGFAVLIGGGLGAQPFMGRVAREFLPEELLIPYIESMLRVFDRHGERLNRHKARFKYLVDRLGLDEVTRLAEAEHAALKVKTLVVDRDALPPPAPPATAPVGEAGIADAGAYALWLRTNTFEQRQSGYFGVHLRIPTGDIGSDRARALAAIVERFADDDIRITADQDLLLRFVRRDLLGHLFIALDAIGLAEPGAASTLDITSCPGTDTCNLGISSSTGITRALERVLAEEYPEMMANTGIRIRISGCMNACGQHAIAGIGLHGSSIRAGDAVLPALQLLLGGGGLGDGRGRLAEKVIKIPSRRGPDALRLILDDYEEHAVDGEYFNDYYDRRGKPYFHRLLKPLADLSTLTPGDFIDWGAEERFETAIGVGECAGVVIDLVATLLLDADEKLASAREALEEERFADGIYHAYAAFVATAKALLLDRGVSCNSQHGIINDFDRHFIADGAFPFPSGFAEHVLRVGSNEPSRAFAAIYIADAASFLDRATMYREARPAPDAAGEPAESDEHNQ